METLTLNDVQFLSEVSQQLGTHFILSFTKDVQPIYTRIGSERTWNSTRVAEWFKGKVGFLVETRQEKPKGLFLLSSFATQLRFGVLHFYSRCLQHEKEALELNHKIVRQKQKLQKQASTQRQQVKNIHHQKLRNQSIAEKLEQLTIDKEKVEEESKELVGEMKRWKEKTKKQKQRGQEYPERDSEELKVQTENYYCDNTGTSAASIQLAVKVFHQSNAGASHTKPTIQYVIQQTTGNDDYKLPVPGKTTVLQQVMNLDKIHFYKESVDLNGRNVALHFDGSPINSMEIYSVVVNWVDDNGIFQQTTLPPLRLVGKKSKEIAETLQQLIDLIGMKPLWYSSDSEATTGAAIRKLNKALRSTAKQSKCTLHSLNNTISDVFKEVFGDSFFSQIEKVTNFIRTYWNKLNNTLLGLHTQLKRPIKALDIRWLTHLLSASYFVDAALHIIASIEKTWGSSPSKTAIEVMALLQDPRFLLKCAIMKVFGAQIYLPCFRWLQEKNGRRISELPGRIRDWLYLYTLIDAHKEDYFSAIYDFAAKKSVESSIVANWIHDICVKGRAETEMRFGSYFKPCFVVAEVVESPQIAKQYLNKIARLTVEERKEYDMFGLISNQEIFKSLEAWSKADDNQKITTFSEGRALWDWYVNHYSFIVIHNAPCERVFSILSEWFRTRFLFFFSVLLAKG